MPRSSSPGMALRTSRSDAPQRRCHGPTTKTWCRLRSPRTRWPRRPSAGPGPSHTSATAARGLPPHAPRRSHRSFAGVHRGLTCGVSDSFAAHIAHGRQASCAHLLAHEAARRREPPLPREADDGIARSFDFGHQDVSGLTFNRTCSITTTSTTTTCFPGSSYQDLLRPWPRLLHHLLGITAARLRTPSFPSNLHRARRLSRRRASRARARPVPAADAPTGVHPHSDQSAPG